MSREMMEMVDAVNKINMKPEMEEEILSNLKRAAAGEAIDRKYGETGREFEKAGSRRRTRSTWQKFVLAAACLLAVIAVAVPVKAIVESVVRERMEQIPKEKLEETAEMLHAGNAQRIAADGFSREFTDAENSRLTELAEKYNRGMFPEGAIMEVEKDEDILPDTFCYSKKTSTYFLPDRELTDEELLQYLDYQQKLNFALAENVKKESVQISDANDAESDTVNTADKNGLPNGMKNTADKDDSQNGMKSTEDQISVRDMEKIAENMLHALFGKDAAALEQHAYYYTDEEAPMMDTIKYKRQYLVNFSVIHDYYYFYIDTTTGNVARAEHSFSGKQEEKMMPEEAEKLLAESRTAAEKLLRESFGKTERIVHVYSSYAINEEGAVEKGGLGFHFVTEGGTDYILVLNGRTKELLEYRDTYYEEYIKIRDEQERCLKEWHGDSDMRVRNYKRIVKEMK